jgi:hypothetical protein
MAINEAKLRDIALEVSAYVTAHQALQKAGQTSRPRLILPDGVRAPGALDDAKRGARLRRIEFLTNRYGLQWLTDQVTAGASPDELDDDALIALGKDFERALECIQDGVSFLDAGLVKAFND